MDKKVKNILSYVFWGAVAVLLIWLCMRSVDWSQFAEALRQCRWGYVVLSMVLGAFVFWLRGCRWRMLLLPIDPATSRLTCFNAYNICMAVNLVLPRAGEVVKLGYVVKHSSRDAEGNRLMTIDKSLGTLLTERIWDAIVTLTMGAVLVFVKWDQFGSGVLEGFNGIFKAAGFMLFIKGIGSGLSSFMHMKKAWVFFVYTAVIWFTYWIMSACIVWALQDIPAFAGLGMTDAFFLMIAGSISSVVPVPGGFGAYHGVVAGALLSIWNIPMGTGMIFATLSHESQAITQALCGLASYIHESFFRK